jgi:hypothetical protein
MQVILSMQGKMRLGMGTQAGWKFLVIQIMTKPKLNVKR